MDASFRKAAEREAHSFCCADPWATHNFMGGTQWAYTYLKAQHQSEVRGLVEALENVAHCEAPIMCANCMYEARQALSAFRGQQGKK